MAMMLTSIKRAAVRMPLWPLLTCGVTASVRSTYFGRVSGVDHSTEISGGESMDPELVNAIRGSCGPMDDF